MDLKAKNSVPTKVDYSQNTQSLKVLYLDQNVANEIQSVDRIKLKIGFGTVLTVSKHQNQTSETS